MEAGPKKKIKPSPQDGDKKPKSARKTPNTSKKADSNNKDADSVSKQDYLSQNQDESRLKDSPPKSATDQQEISEMNDRIDDEKSFYSRGDGEGEGEVEGEGEGEGDGEGDGEIDGNEDGEEGEIVGEIEGDGDGDGEIDGEDADSVESFEQRRRQFNFDKPKSWELQPVKIANVWDFLPDLVVYKWIKVRESEPVTHKREKDKSKLYRCKQEECGKVFSDQPSLKKHMLTHGERMFLCPYEGCGKKFLDNSKLKRHYLVHTGEKRFKCDICGKLFSLDFNLRTHMRTHTGEKPYFCRFPGCTKRFTQSSNLSAHEKIHLTKELSIKSKEKGAESMSEA